MPSTREGVRDTVRLWCIAPTGLENLVPEINRRFRWARLFVPLGEPSPAWSGSLGGKSWSMNESHGEYEGSFGFPGTGSEQAGDEEGLIRDLRRKHPLWSEAKFERALEDLRRAGSRRIDANRHRGLKPEDLWECLRLITSIGPVLFLLDDGGLIPVDRGGTWGLSCESRSARWNQSYRIDVAVDPPGSGLPLPYWTPATVGSHLPRPSRDPLFRA